MPYSNKQKHAAIVRELGYRKRAYPRWVVDGRMTQKLADEQIAIFEEIAADYAEKAQQDEPPRLPL
jgi:hypothetical protein